MPDEKNPSLFDLWNKPVTTNASFGAPKKSWTENFREGLQEFAVSSIDSTLLGIPGIIDEKLDGERDVFGRDFSSLTSAEKAGRAGGEAVGFIAPVGAIGKGTSMIARGVMKSGIKGGAKRIAKEVGQAPLSKYLSKGEKLGKGAPKTFDDLINKVVRKDTKTADALMPYSTPKELTKAVEKNFIGSMNKSMTDEMAKLGIDVSDKAVIGKIDEVTGAFAKRLREHGPYADNLEDIIKLKLGATGKVSKKLAGYGAQAAGMTLNMGLYNNLYSGIQGQFDENYDYNAWESTKAILPIAALGPLIQAIPGGRSAPLYKDAVKVIKNTVGRKINFAKYDDKALKGLTKLYAGFDDKFKQKILTKADAGNLRGVIDKLGKDDLIDLLSTYSRVSKRELLSGFSKEAVKDVVGSMPRMIADGVMFNALAFGNAEAFMSLSKEEMASHIITGALMAKRRVALDGSASGQMYRYGEGNFADRVKALEFFGLDNSEIKKMVRFKTSEHLSMERAHSIRQSPVAQKINDVFNTKKVPLEERTANRFNETQLAAFEDVKRLHDSLFVFDQFAKEIEGGREPNNESISSGLEYLSGKELEQVRNELNDILLEDGVTRIGDVTYIEALADIAKTKSESIEASYVDSIERIAAKFGMIPQRDKNRKLTISQLSPRLRGEDGKGAEFIALVTRMQQLGVISVRQGDKPASLDKVIDDSFEKNARAMDDFISKEFEGIENELVRGVENKEFIGNLDVNDNHYLNEIGEASKLRAIVRMTEAFDGGSKDEKLNGLHTALLSHFSVDGDGKFIVSRDNLVDAERDEDMSDAEVADFEANVPFLNFLHEHFGMGKIKAASDAQPAVKLTMKEVNTLVRNAKETIVGSSRFAEDILNQSSEYGVDVLASMDEHRAMKMMGNRPVGLGAFAVFDNYLSNGVFERDGKGGVQVLSRKNIRKRIEERLGTVDPEKVDVLMDKYDSTIDQLGASRDRITEVEDFTLTGNEKPEDSNIIQVIEHTYEMTNRRYEQSIGELVKSIDTELTTKLSENLNHLGPVFDKLRLDIDKMMNNNMDKNRFEEVGADLTNVIESIDAVLSESKLDKQTRDTLTELQKGTVVLMEKFNQDVSGGYDGIQDVYQRLTATIGKYEGNTIPEKINSMLGTVTGKRKQLSDILNALTFNGRISTMDKQKALRTTSRIRKELFDIINEERVRNGENRLDEVFDNTDPMKQLETLYNLTGDIDVLNQVMGRIYVEENRTITDGEYQVLHDAKLREMDELERIEHRENHANSLDEVRVRHFGNNTDFTSPMLRSSDGRIDEAFTADISNMFVRGEGDAAVKKLTTEVDKLIDKNSDDPLQAKADFREKELPGILSNLATQKRRKVLELVHTKDGQSQFVLKETLSRHGNAREDFYKVLEDANITLFEANKTNTINGRRASLTDLQGDASSIVANTRNVRTVPFADADAREVAGTAGKEGVAAEVNNPDAFVEGLPALLRKDVAMIQEHAKMGFELIEMSEGAGFYVPNTPETSKAISGLYTKWYDTTLAKMKELSGPKDIAVENFERIFGKKYEQAKSIQNSGKDMVLTAHEKRVMLRGMYYTKQNASGFRKMMNTSQQGVDFAKASTGFFKYIKTSEASNYKRMDDTVLKSIEDTHSDADVRASVGKIRKNGINVLAIGDESGGGKSIMSAMKYTRDDYQRRIDQANEAGNEVKAKQLQAQLDDVNNRFGQIEDSGFNGATFLGTDFQRTVLAANGLKIGDGNGGVKPVVHHNDEATMSSSILKTHFFYDPVLASYLDKKGVDMLTFESSAKAYDDTKMMDAEGYMPREGMDARESLGAWLGEKEVGNNIVNLPIGAVKMGSTVKATKEATASNSLTNFGGPEQIREFVAFVRLRENLQDYSRQISDMKSGQDYGALASFMVKDRIERSYDPTMSTHNTSKGFASTLLGFGYPPDASLLKYEMQQMAKEMTYDKLSQVKAPNSAVSAFMPELGLRAPAFRGNKQVAFGEIKLNEGINGPGGIRVKDADKQTYAVNIDGRDIVVTRRNGQLDVSDVFKGETGWKGLDDAQKAEINSVIDEIRFDIDKNGDKGIVDVAEFLANHEKAMKLDMQIAVSDLRIPRKSASDVLINRVHPVAYERNFGNVVGSNSFEVATKHQGDFDVDKMNVYGELPWSMIQQNHKLSGLVVDTPTLGDKSYSIDMFETGDNSRDGIQKHKRDFEFQRGLLGQVIKSFKTMTYMSNFGMTVNKNGQRLGVLNLNDMDAMRSFTAKAAIITQSSLDNQKGFNEIINDPAIMDYLLFNDKTIFEKTGRKESEFQELITERFGDDVDLNVSLIKGVDGTSRVEKEAVREIIIGMNQLSRISGNVYDEMGGRRPEFAEVRSIYLNASSMLKSPSKFVFERMMFKYKNDSGMKVDIMKYFFGDDVKGINDLNRYLRNLNTERPGDLLGKTDPIGFAEKANLDAIPEGIIGKHIAFNKDLGHDPIPAATAAKEGQLAERIEDYLMTRTFYEGGDTTEGQIIKDIEENVFANYSFVKNTESRALTYDLMEKRYNYVMNEIANAQRKDYTNESYIEFLSTKAANLAQGMDAVMNKRMRDLGFTKEEGGGSILNVMKRGRGDYIDHNGQGVSHVYKINTDKPMDAIQYSDLEFVGVARYGRSVRAEGNGVYVKLDNPIRRSKGNTNDNAEGYSWFMATDYMTPENTVERFSKEQYDVIYDELDRVRKDLWLNSNEYKSKVKNNPVGAREIWQERSVGESAIISRFMDKFMEGASDPSERINDLVTLLLQPRLVEGEVASFGKIDLPKFKVNARMTKAVMTWVMNYGTPSNRDYLRQVSSYVGDQFRVIRQNKQPKTNLLPRAYDHYASNNDFFYATSQMKQGGFINDILNNSRMYEGSFMELIRAQYPEYFRRYKGKRVMKDAEGNYYEGASYQYQDSINPGPDAPGAQRQQSEIENGDIIAEARKTYNCGS